MKRLTTAATIATFALTAGTASAATVASYTHDYGTGAGQVDPIGNDKVNKTNVVVKDRKNNAFLDVFDFSGLVYNTIESISLTLTFEGAGPRGNKENWAVQLFGSNTASTDDDVFASLIDGSSPQTATVSVSSDTAGADVFANAVATGNFSFGFSEATSGNGQFRLFSSVLTIDGTATDGPAAPVPLPAGLPLMLLGLGGIAALRRRNNG